MNAVVYVPADEDAEAVIAHSALVYSSAWATASAHVDRSDFTSWKYWEVVEVCATLPDQCALPSMPEDDPSSWVTAWWLPYSAREIAAINAGVRTEVVDDLSRVMAASDITPYVRRLLEASRRREAMTYLADAYNLIGAGAEISAIRPMIDRIVALEEVAA